MRKIIIATVAGKPVDCYEVEFVDMDHTLVFLLETAEKYEFTHAITYLEITREIIAEKRRVLFG